MKTTISYFSRLISLLFLTFITYSCNKNNRNDSKIIITENLKNNDAQTDSIKISVSFKTEVAFGFNIKDKYHQYYFLEFINEFKKDTTITKKIPRLHKNQLIDAFDIKNENVEKVVNKVEDIAQDSVDILTDDNKDNEAQFKALFEEKKFEVLEVGLEVAESEFAIIKDETTKVVALAALKIVREAIANPHAKLTEQDVSDFLQTANLEVAK